MKRLISILLATAVMTGAASAQAKKPLVVYFSLAGEQYKSHR